VVSTISLIPEDIHSEIKLDNPCYRNKTIFFVSKPAGFGIKGESYKMFATWHIGRGNFSISAYSPVEVPEEMNEEIINNTRVANYKRDSLLENLPKLGRNIDNDIIWFLTNHPLMKGVQVLANIDIGTGTTYEVVMTSTGGKIITSLPEGILDHYAKVGFASTMCITDCRVHFGDTWYIKIDSWWNILGPKLPTLNDILMGVEHRRNDPNLCLIYLFFYSKYLYNEI
jgi:hypothetical protein